jgi:hypothetical protein
MYHISVYPVAPNLWRWESCPPAPPRKSAGQEAGKA